ncbi:MAG: zf-HC2 domain-containing protein [Armatimonadetes bacterium]|nr:zf-HC2 domain-containing protein [Armatimonadota bacterium]
MKHQPCESMIELLSLYIDQMTNPNETAEAEAHLEQCEGCRETVAAWRGFSAAIAQTEEALPPSDLRDRVLAATTRKPVRAWFLRPAWLAAPALAATLALYAILTNPGPVPIDKGPVVSSVMEERTLPLAETPVVVADAPNSGFTEDAAPRAFNRTANAKPIPNTPIARRNAPIVSVPTEEPIEVSEGPREPTLDDRVMVSFLDEAVYEEPEAPPVKLANLLPEPETTLKDDLAGLMKAQLAKDQDRLVDLRQRNVAKRRIGIPIATIRF